MFLNYLSVVRMISLSIPNHVRTYTKFRFVWKRRCLLIIHLITSSVDTIIILNKLPRCCLHRSDTDPVLTHYDMFTDLPGWTGWLATPWWRLTPAECAWLRKRWRATASCENLKSDIKRLIRMRYHIKYVIRMTYSNVRGWLKVA